MVHADPDDIATLVLDPGSVPAAVRDHVRSCDECRSLETALTSVSAGVRHSRADGPLVAPPEDLRGRVLDAAVGGPSATDQAATEVPGAVLPMSPARARRHGVPLWAAGLAAAVTLVAGLGIGHVTAGPESPTDPAVDVVASADLTSLERADPRGLARAVVTGGAEGSGDVFTLQVDAEALGGREGIHEVWLLNVDGTRMIAVGLLADDDEGEFEVPTALLDGGYRIVDISVEPDDGDPTHSGVSLARGELA